MRPPDKIEDKEKLSDIESVLSKNNTRNSDRITFIKLVDSSVSSKHLKGLGKSVCTSL